MSEPAMLLAPILAKEISRVARDVDAVFDRVLAVPDDPRAPLYRAMRHAAMDGGKRLRPLLTIATGRLFGVAHDAALWTGTAIEAVHVYSLIHDDLPCMDDDDLRRGRPTVHRAFDEGIAVLAGDALHAVAFEMIASEQASHDSFIRAQLAVGLARASGPAGMAGGQMMDIASADSRYDLPQVTRLQQLKTGAMIAFAVEAGTILGRAGPDAQARLHAYARDIGLAFQIADDLLDVTGDADAAGKALRKDEAQGKVTFVSLLGESRARSQAQILADQAVAHLGSFGEDAEVLRAVARFAVERDR